MSSHDITVTEDLGAEAGWLVLSAIMDVLAQKERCLLAVPGGSSPGPVFSWLAQNIPADVARRLTLTLVDERHLPLVSPFWMDLPEQSNTRQLWALWLAVVDESCKPWFIPFARQGELEQVRQWIEADLPHPPDVLLVGAGPDGHIASLFPDHPALGETGPVLAITDSPKPPASRLTLSMPCLNKALHAIVIARGAGKAPAVARALSGDRSLPLGRLGGPRIQWVLDADAATLLPETS